MITTVAAETNSDYCYYYCMFLAFQTVPLSMPSEGGGVQTFHVGFINALWYGEWPEVLIPTVRKHVVVLVRACVRACLCV